jgi:hypothetical protein
MPHCLVTNGYFRVPYSEEDGYQEEWAPDLNTSTRILRCDWGAKEQFVLDLVGWNALAGSQLVRYPPDPHPRLPQFFCTDVKLLKGVGVLDREPGGVIHYSQRASIGGGNSGDGYARFQAVYRTLDWDTGPPGAVANELSRYVSRTETFAGENLTLPVGAFMWDDSKQPILQPTTRTMYEIGCNYHWHQVPGTNINLAGALDNNILNTVGRVNRDAFDGLYAPETLLFIAPDRKRIHTATGAIAYELNYAFVWRPTGWNHLFRASTGNFVRVVRTNDALLGIYETAPFDKLFSFQQ